MGAIGRTIIGVVVEAVTFVALGTIAFIIMRVEWPAYAAVEKAMQFDQPMMIARLSVAGGALFLAGWLIAFTVRDSRTAPLAGGIMLLLLFIPNHVMLWDKFPIWYHLTFLTSLPVLTFLGGKLART